MIYVNRNSVPCPSILDGAKSKGGKEKSEAINRFNNNEKLKEFKIYSEPEVKWSLNQLFHGKCAYCESKYNMTQPMDVEHFRPKGAIALEDDNRDYGYYWLAAEWTNLLPSCIDCNRRRTQTSGLTGKAFSMGKADKFPIANEKDRAIKPGEESNEIALLLDPCDPSENPEDHLVYEEDGIILPKKNSLKGLNSIRVFGLNRIALVTARREKIYRINQIKYKINNLILEATKSNSNLDEFKKDILFEEMNTLVAMTSPTKSFTGLGRQFVRQFSKEINQYFNIELK